MKCNEIYEAAMAHLGIEPYTDTSAEYEKRAPYMLCAICYEMSYADREYRTAFGKEPSRGFEGLDLPLTADFPLSERFASAATYCLASSLAASIIPSPDVSSDSASDYSSVFSAEVTRNSKLSDEYYLRYNQSMKDIYSEIPASSGKTVNVYPE